MNENQENIGRHRGRRDILCVLQKIPLKVGSAGTDLCTGIGGERRLVMDFNGSLVQRIF